MSALSQRSLASNPSAEVLSGVISTVRFYNPKNGWAVLSVHTGGESVTAVGPCVNPREGDEYEFRGSFVTDPKWGRQFKFESAEVLLPSTRKGVIRYLASIAYGVGEVRAARIVGALGDDCLAKLQADPDLLDTLDFLTTAQKEEIKLHLREHSVVAEVSGLICREGLTPHLAARIVAHFGEDAVRIVKEEPYRLTELEGIGFLTADRIAMAVGIKPDAPARIQAAIRHILSEAENDGHCSLRPNDLVKQIPALLGTDIGVPTIAEAVATLIEAEMLVRDGDDIYLTELYEAECKVTECIQCLLSNPCEVPASLYSIVQAIESEKEVDSVG